MVRMQVAGLSLDEQTKAPILVLQGTGSEEVLPIWIGAMEAMAISMVLNKVEVPRPLTHDLMLTSLATVGAELIAVEITSLERGTYYAELLMLAGEEQHRIDCRPSDAIALALRVDAPILVASQVLEDAQTDKLRPAQGDPAVLKQPEDAAAQIMRRANEARERLARRASESDPQTREPGYDTDSDADEDELSELLKSLEPDTKYKM